MSTGSSGIAFRAKNAPCGHALHPDVEADRRQVPFDDLRGQRLAGRRRCIARPSAPRVPRASRGARRRSGREAGRSSRPGSRERRRKILVGELPASVARPRDRGRWRGPPLVEGGVVPKSGREVLSAKPRKPSPGTTKNRDLLTPYFSSEPSRGSKVTSRGVRPQSASPRSISSSIRSGVLGPEIDEEPVDVV